MCYCAGCMALRKFSYLLFFFIQKKIEKNLSQFFHSHPHNVVVYDFMDIKLSFAKILPFLAIHMLFHFDAWTEAALTILAFTLYSIRSLTACFSLAN